MKKQIYIIAIIALFLGGCEDFLDRKPLGQETTESFLGNPAMSEANFEQMIHACYTVFYISEQTVLNNAHFGDWMLGDWLSDDCEKGGNGAGDFPEVLDWRTWTTVATGGSHHENTYWTAGWLGVNRANTVLDLLEKYSSNLTPATYDRIKGEALFIKGYFYFLLAKAYGGTPYFDKPVTSNDYYDAPKLSPEELYAKVEQIFTAALALAPEKDAWGNIFPGGRATKGAVRAFLARVISMEIGFGFNGKVWQDVYDVTKAIIDSKKYTLAANYATIFEQEGENNSEAVFEIQCDNVTTTYGAPGGNLQPRMTTFRPDPALNPLTKRLTLGGWGFSCPSKNLYNEFEAGDVRRECTIIANGAIMWEDGNLATDESIGVQETGDCPTGYWSRKYSTTIEQTPSINTGGVNNMRKCRYAEVLLLHAEAAYHIGAEAEAYETVSLVRTRAINSTPPLGSELENPGYPAAPGTLAPIAATSGAALLTAIKHERRMELAIEGNRAWDLIRWGEYEDAIRRYIPEDHFLGSRDPEIVIASYRTHLIDGKVPCMPIPPNEVSAYRIPQNPGY